MTLPSPVLPDLLPCGLDVVFCGSRPGEISAKRKAYYAHRGNKFWPTLHAIGLTPRQFEPSEFATVLELGIGLTDLGKDSFGQDKGWKPTPADLQRLRLDIERCAPKVLAFTSKYSAKHFLGHNVEYGRQTETIGSTILYVLPSTSGANSARWDIQPWRELGELVRKLHQRGRPQRTTVRRSPKSHRSS